MCVPSIEGHVFVGLKTAFWFDIGTYAGTVTTLRTKDRMLGGYGQCI